MYKIKYQPAQLGKQSCKVLREMRKGNASERHIVVIEVRLIAQIGG